MVSPLDWVFKVVPVTTPGAVAVTRTGVLTVPELTIVCTKPAASEVAEALLMVIPPTVVLSPIVTGVPANAFPALSTTLN